MEEDNPIALQEAFSIVVGGLLEEALKDHIGAPQLENVVGPPYLRNKRRASNKRSVSFKCWVFEAL